MKMQKHNANIESKINWNSSHRYPDSPGANFASLEFPSHWPYHAPAPQYWYEEKKEEDDAARSPARGLLCPPPQARAGGPAAATPAGTRGCRPCPRLARRAGGASRRGAGSLPFAGDMALVVSHAGRPTATTLRPGGGDPASNGCCPSPRGPGLGSALPHGQQPLGGGARDHASPPCLSIRVWP